MPATYRIHPGIGVARVGNSPAAWCISPEAPAALPIECDDLGNPRLTPDGEDVVRVSAFKDAEGRIKRQAARFQIYVYDDDAPEGRPLRVGDRVAGGGNSGTLVDIQWRVYLANKKASWYTFEQLEGEHGYAPDHPRRNAAITDDEARTRLIIDPGPRGVDRTTRRRAAFDRDTDGYATTFPPPLDPKSIDTLGGLRCDDHGRLLVLGGHGHSGSYLGTGDGFGQPLINDYANNDGWFDDVSDGPVTARLVMFDEQVQRQRYIDVEYPAWCIVGYPAFVPEILDMVTMAEVVEDLGVRQFATRPDLYGPPGSFENPPCIDPTDQKALSHWRAGALAWNRDHKPWFWRDLWPILFRPDEFSYLTDVLAQSNFPHNQTARGNFDPYKLGVPPVVNHRAVEACEATCVERNRRGELFLEALDPSITLVDSEANAGLRQTLETFDRSVRQAIAAARAAGEGPTEADVEAYEEWLRRLRVRFPNVLGKLLFGRLRQRIEGSGGAARLALADDEDGLPAAVAEPFGAFADAVEAGAEVDTAAEIADDDPKALGEGTPDRPPAPRLDAYTRRWRAQTGGADDGASAAAGKLARTLATVVDRLHGRAAQSFADLVDDGAAVLDGWGGAFPALLDPVRAFGEKHDAPASPLDLLFDRLQSFVRKQAGAFVSGKLLEDCQRACVAAHTHDPYGPLRAYLYALLRQPGDENQFRLGGRPDDKLYKLPLMPLLAGDNPISNTLPSKFLKLTDTQLYLLRQWAEGRFVNEAIEGWIPPPNPMTPYAQWTNDTPAKLDRGVLSNVLGGAFCPGGEVGWVLRNPSVYLTPFRIKADPTFSSFRETAAQANFNPVAPSDYAGDVEEALSQTNDFETGLQPGDLTKYMALPWQADFNECSMQPIDITYEDWNDLYPASDHDRRMARERQSWQTLWWPAHRPLQTVEITSGAGADATFQWVQWAKGIPQTNAGDQMMTWAWSGLGFVILNPYVDVATLDYLNPPVNKYISIERSSTEP